MIWGGVLGPWGGAITCLDFETFLTFADAPPHCGGEHTSQTQILGWSTLNQLKPLEGKEARRRRKFLRIFNLFVTICKGETARCRRKFCGF